MWHRTNLDWTYVRNQWEQYVADWQFSHICEMAHVGQHEQILIYFSAWGCTIYIYVAAIAFCSGQLQYIGIRLLGSDYKAR